MSLLPKVYLLYDSLLWNKLPSFNSLIFSLQYNFYIISSSPFKLCYCCCCLQKLEWLYSFVGLFVLFYLNPERWFAEHFFPVDFLFSSVIKKIFFSYFVEEFSYFLHYHFWILSYKDIVVLNQLTLDFCEENHLCLSFYRVLFLSSFPTLVLYNSSKFKPSESWNTKLNKL